MQSQGVNWKKVHIGFSVKKRCVVQVHTILGLAVGLHAEILALVSDVVHVK